MSRPCYRAPVEQSRDLAELARRLRREQPGTQEREQWLEEMRKRVKEGAYEVDSQTLAQDLVRKAFRRKPKPSS